MHLCHNATEALTRINSEGWPQVNKDGLPVCKTKQKTSKKVCEVQQKQSVDRLKIINTRKTGSEEFGREGKRSINLICEGRLLTWTCLATKEIGY